MSKNITVKLNGRGVAELLNSDDVRRALTSMAGPVLADAINRAPVDSGEYKASLHIAQDTTDRVAVRVGSSAPHAFVVEARYGTLARALDAAG